MEHLKKHFWVFLGSACLSLMVMIGGLAGYSMDKAQSIEIDLPEQKLEIVGGAFTTKLTPNTATATASTFLTAGATSTLVMETPSAESIDMLLQVRASSTGNLVYNVQFSNDLVDWYYEDQRTLVSNTSTTHGGFVSHSLSLATSSLPIADETIRSNISITPTASRFARINYSTDVNAQVYLGAVLKNSRDY